MMTVTRKDDLLTGASSGFVAGAGSMRAPTLNPLADPRFREAVELTRVVTAHRALVEKLSSIGTARPRRPNLDDAGEFGEQDREEIVATTERKLMVRNLSSVIDYLLECPDVPASHAATLMRLYYGLLRVETGRTFYAFEPRRDLRAPGVCPVALYRRGAIAASVTAYMRSGMPRAAALALVEKRMRECVSADFDCPPHSVIEARTIGEWRDQFSRERGATLKGSIALARYREFVATIQRLAPGGSTSLTRFADRLLAAAIDRE